MSKRLARSYAFQLLHHLDEDSRFWQKMDIVTRLYERFGFVEIDVSKL